MYSRISEFTPDAMLELRPQGAPALAATDTTGVARKISAQTFLSLSVVITASGFTSYSPGISYWEVIVEVSDTPTGVFVEVGRLALRGNPVKVRVGIHGAEIEHATANPANYIRTRAIRTGNPGNLSYSAYVAPVIHHP